MLPGDFYFVVSNGNASGVKKAVRKGRNDKQAEVLRRRNKSWFLTSARSLYFGFVATPQELLIWWLWVFFSQRDGAAGA